jgi:hypothetical protein
VRRAGVYGKLLKSCACAQVRVAQPIVDLHFCRCNVPPNDGDHVLVRYKDNVDVFRADMVDSRTGQLTMQLIWNQASIYHMAESTILSIIIVWDSTGLVCEEGWWTEAVCGIPSSQ